MIRPCSRSMFVLSGAIALTVGGVGCQPPHTLDGTNNSSELDSATVAAKGFAPDTSSSRGQDPTSVHAPLYLIRAVVETDETANASSLVWEKIGDANHSNLHTFAPADKLRVGLEAVISKNGQLSDGAPPVTCQVGTFRDGGDIPGDFWTTPGGVYSTCMKNPDNPAIANQPIAFNAPIAVGPGDTLNLYTRLEVLNGGIVWAPASDPNAGVPGALKGLGAFFSALGDFLPGTPVGDAAHVVGTSLSLTGQFTTPDQHDVQEACFITQSLIPGFNSNQPPSDNDSPLLRAQLDGRQLYEATSRGAGILSYDLDWRAFPQTAMCLGQRPHTRVSYIIERVQMSGDSAASAISKAPRWSVPSPICSTRSPSIATVRWSTISAAPIALARSPGSPATPCPPLRCRRTPPSRRCRARPAISISTPSRRAATSSARGATNGPTATPGIRGST